MLDFLWSMFQLLLGMFGIPLTVVAVFVFISWLTNPHFWDKRNDEDAN